MVNEKLKKQFTLEYSNESLPHFVEWKSMCSSDYALGLEPSTTKLDRKFEYKKIKPDENIEFNLNITVDNI